MATTRVEPGEVPAGSEVEGSRAVGATARLGVWGAVTPLGRTVLAVALLMWVGAAITGWEELALVSAAGMLSLLVGIAALIAGRANLSVVLDLGTPRVVVGDAAETNVRTTNEAGRRMLPVRLEAPVGRGIAHVNVPSLGAKASHEGTVAVPTVRRAIVPVGPVRSVQGDPLGLVRREVTWTGTENLYVHPRTVDVASLTTGFLRDLEGETTNDRSPSDVAFHTLREYVIGDDRRHIHWRTTARQPDGKLMVREFVDTRRAHLALVISLRAEDYASTDEFELAVGCLGSIGVRSLSDEKDTSCMAGGRRLPTHHGASFLDGLSGLVLGADETTLPSAVARGRDVFAGSSVAVLVTGSAVDPASVQQACDRFGPSVSTIIVRTAVGAESTISTTMSSPQIQVGSLDELPRLIWAVVAR